MPGSWRNMYEPGEVPIPVGTLAPEEQVRIQTERVKTDCNGNKKSALRSRCVNGAREQLEPETEEEQRIFIAEFYAMISSIDDSVGRILDDLDRLGITDDTKVVFFSDHCDMPGEHVYDCGCKPQGYRAAMQVPLLIRTRAALRRDDARVR